ncbi:MBOAT family O-acyltransferase [Clostridium sp. BJN0001]|uniref:MBOAT family O-acyltransferase n=1 Tax=Clostridium sp. BJN0001 TaxID=2930219 RepID=UPI0032AFC4BD
MYIFLLLFSTAIEYIMSKHIYKNRKDKEKCRFLLVFTLAINISILFFFKYYGFLIDNINEIFNTSLKIRDLPLPLGISFYTFKLISYICDVYKGEVKPAKSFINLGVYSALLFEIGSGPISKYSDLVVSIESRKSSIDKMGLGIERFIIGLGKKLIISNNIALIWTQVKALQMGQMSVLSAWIGIIAFTLQIYFDFSGYSDMAIGLGQMFGFDINENFNYPYISKSVSEFWRRWHISLGTWFKDYIYFPLGGNRCSKICNFRNIFIVWFVTGLWHGASWNFIIWGLYFGFFVYSEKLFLSKILKKIPPIFRIIYTMFVVVIGWVFFDLPTLKDAGEFIKILFGAGYAFSDNLSIYLLRTNYIILLFALIVSTPLIKYIFDFLRKRVKRGPIILIIICFIVFILSIAYLVNQSYSPFLYFKF